MKQNGFTLVELLAVIVLLAIISMLIFPSVTNIILQSRETTYTKKINTILNATYDFSLKNINFLPDRGEKQYILLSQLKQYGLLPDNLKNPYTNKNFPDNLVISINNVGSGYKYSNQNSILEGDYLYTVEIENLNNSSKNLLPTITLTNDLKPLTVNSDGNYIITLDLNEELSNIKYSAHSHDNKDLTNKIIKYITLNDKAVDEIITSKQAIYKINYSVVDENGYSNSIFLNVIVADNTPPTISFPKNTVINKDSINYDLMNQVNCEDNSGFCDIEFSGDIDYGVIGKYIIEYTSKDPSGNTSTKKRVIEIE